MAVHVVTPLHTHTHSIIFLHGRDSTAEEFAGELFESQASDGRFLQEIFPSIRWIFPTSRIRKSARFGVELSQWFDIWACESPQESKDLQVAGIRETLEDLETIITTEIARLDGKTNHVFLAGISQGCAAAVLKLLSQPIAPFAGFLGFSSWLPFQAEIGQLRISESTPCMLLHSLFSLNTPIQSPIDPKPSVLGTPVFLAHCNDDTIIPVENGEALARHLRELGMNVTWRQYQDGGHWINEPVGLDDLVTFIKVCMEVKPS